MAKTTSTILEMITAEFVRGGGSEFENRILYPQGNPQQLTFNNAKYSVIGKVARWDNEIQAIVNEFIFAGYAFPNADLDKFFKKMFINRFEAREPKYQTIDRLRTELISWCASHELIYKEFWENLENYLTGKATQHGTTSTKDGNNNASAELPQDTALTDLTANFIDYADQNNVTRGFADTVSDNTSQQFDPQTLLKFNRFWQQQLEELDEMFFLHVW